MVLNILFGLYLVLVLVLVLLKLRSREFFEALPSLFWASMMALPFWVQQSVFSQPEALYQSAGILAIGLALFIGDSLPGRRVTLTGSVGDPGANFLAHSLLILTAGLEVIHLGLLEDQILLIRWIYGEPVVEIDPTLTYSPFHFVFLILLLVLIPMTLSMLLKCRSIALAAFLAVLSIFYGSNISVEWAILFTMLGLLLFGTEVSRYVSRKIWLVTAAVLVIPFTGLYISLAAQGMGAFHSKISAEEVQKFQEEELFQPNEIVDLTRADQFRLLRMTDRYQELSLASRWLNLALYSTFLLPSEAAHRWYQYFPGVAQQKAPLHLDLPLLGLGERMMGAGNEVGLWAYKRRFPSQYAETITMRVSPDAHSFAMFGVGGIVAVAILILLIRLAIKGLKVRSPWGDSISASCLFLFAFGLPNAPLLMILVRYGVLFYMVVMGVHYFFCRRYIQEEYLPSYRVFD